ncbi:hypothetical protein TNIN_68941 [Trichonephila inaurata madagascariensis]|uniref:Uncharacterized protein n=1 Tax=Trichonephila inaurata madagascariensis TaxID=2747483 RepID=A0A8X7CHT7_9ARAC|nr:hypothetical protein TNIN_68941 [Trichonephila inaurata madagascariensis]
MIRHGLDPFWVPSKYSILNFTENIQYLQCPESARGKELNQKYSFISTVEVSISITVGCLRPVKDKRSTWGGLTKEKLIRALWAYVCALEGPCAAGQIYGLPGRYNFPLTWKNHWTLAGVVALGTLRSQHRYHGAEKERFRRSGAVKKQRIALKKMAFMEVKGRKGSLKRLPSTSQLTNKSQELEMVARQILWPWQSGPVTDDESEDVSGLCLPAPGCRVPLASASQV